MAIRDLLWACPICEREGGLTPTRRAEECTSCGTLFRRGRGATIIANSPEGETLALHATEWSKKLPPIDLETRPRPVAAEPDLLHREPVLVRFVEALNALRHRGAYLNRIERFGNTQEGVLSLERERIRLDGLPGAEPIEWPFHSICAVQPSSSTLQIQAAQQPLVSFRFPEGSARLWEELLTEALRAFYRAHGRGEIIEFQPRITTR